jgi:hypothetical protein
MLGCFDTNCITNLVDPKKLIQKISCIAQHSLFRERRTFDLINTISYFDISTKLRERGEGGFCSFPLVLFAMWRPNLSALVRSFPPFPQHPKCWGCNTSPLYLSPPWEREEV